MLIVRVNRYGFVSENWLMKETAILAYGLSEIRQKNFHRFWYRFLFL